MNKKRFLSILLIAVFMLGLTACIKDISVSSLGEKGDISSSVLPPFSAAGTGESASVSPVPAGFQDNGIFSASYEKAYQRLTGMTTQEKVGQLFWARCPETGAEEDIAAYHLGGLVLFKRDFADKSAAEVAATLQRYQNAAAIPLLLAVDEEGGTVARVSACEMLRPQGRFQAQGDLYAKGGLEALLADTQEKDALLLSLGINVNLAPVADIARSAEDFMYERSLRQDAATTASVLDALTARMLTDGIQPTLKHFPGYGNNADTHTGIAIDGRLYESFENEDFLPFRAGIAAGAPCVLVSHNIVNCMDASLPASLSPEVHRILREKLGFTGAVTTDELDMGAIQEFTGGENPCVQALLAGNDLLMVTDYQGGYAAVLAAVENGTVPMETLDHAVFRILAWKYSIGLL